MRQVAFPAERFGSGPTRRPVERKALPPETETVVSVRGVCAQIAAAHTSAGVDGLPALPECSVRVPAVQTAAA
jgi:hypothetical protein